MNKFWSWKNKMVKDEVQERILFLNGIIAENKSKGYILEIKEENETEIDS